MNNNVCLQETERAHTAVMGHLGGINVTSETRASQLLGIVEQHAANLRQAVVIFTKSARQMDGDFADKLFQGMRSAYKRGVEATIRGKNKEMTAKLTALQQACDEKLDRCRQAAEVDKRSQAAVAQTLCEECLDRQRAEVCGCRQQRCDLALLPALQRSMKGHPPVLQVEQAAEQRVQEAQQQVHAAEHDLAQARHAIKTLKEALEEAKEAKVAAEAWRGKYEKQLRVTKQVNNELAEYQVCCSQLYVCTHTTKL